jgi:hypothetical protein
LGLAVGFGGLQPASNRDLAGKSRVLLWERAVRRRFSKRGERFVLYQAVREYFVCTALTECIPKIAVQALGCTASLARFPFRPNV